MTRSPFSGLIWKQREMNPYILHAFSLLLFIQGPVNGMVPCTFKVSSPPQLNLSRTPTQTCLEERLLGDSKSKQDAYRDEPQVPLPGSFIK